jgi:hypothetical protein
LQENFVAVAKGNAAKAVPFRLVLPFVADRDLVHGTRLHRRQWRFQLEWHVLFRISSRLELRRTFAFSHGASNADISKFAPIDRATEQKSAPTHVAATNEIGRKAKALPEVFQKDVDIFSRRHAAEQHGLALRR